MNLDLNTRVVYGQGLEVVCHQLASGEILPMPKNGQILSATPIEVDGETLLEVWVGAPNEDQGADTDERRIEVPAPRMIDLPEVDHDDDYPVNSEHPSTQLADDHDLDEDAEEPDDDFYF